MAEPRYCGCVHGERARRSIPGIRDLILDIYCTSCKCSGVLTEEAIDLERAKELGFTKDQWGRWAMPGEWRLPPGAGDDSHGTRGINAAGMTEHQLQECFGLVARLDAYWLKAHGAQFGPKPAEE